MTIELYAFEDSDGTLHTFTTFDSMKAKEYAQDHSCRCIAQIHEYTESELVWDFSEEEEWKVVHMGTGQPIHAGFESESDAYDWLEGSWAAGALPASDIKEYVVERVLL